MSGPQVPPGPPRSDEAERALIGCILCEPRAYGAAARLVNPADFWSPTNQAIFQAIERLSGSGIAPLEATILPALKGASAEPEEGWEEYLRQRVGDVPSGADAESFARTIRTVAARREFYYLGQLLTDEAASGDLPRLVGMVLERSLAATAATNARPVRSAKEVADELLASMRAEDTVSTGLVSLDGQIGGLRRGDLIVLAGRPSMGKSTLAQNVGEHVASEGGTVLHFTLEMPAKAVLARMVCRRTLVPFRRLVAGLLADEETERVGAALRDLARLPLFFCDRSSLTIADVMAEAHRTRALHGLGLVVVDYLQLMDTERAERREREIGQLSRSLKRLAGELDVPVLCLSQLNRDLEKRRDKRPMLSDLRDSGSIEQDADIVVLLHRERVYDKDAPPDRAEIIVAKQRNGAAGRASVRFIGEEFRFADAGEGVE